MVDATPTFDAYRECVRHLWNAHFVPVLEHLDKPQASEHFYEVEVSLFRQLVLARYAPKRMWEEFDGYPFFHLEIVSPRAEVYISAGSGSGRWDQPPRFALPAEFEFEFLWFWDWYDFGVREYSLYHAHVRSSETYPDLVGREVLVPVGSHIRVVFNEAAA